VENGPFGIDKSLHGEWHTLYTFIFFTYLWAAGKKTDNTPNHVQYRKTSIKRWVLNKCWGLL